MTTARTGAATTIEELTRHLLGARLPVGVLAWDSSTAGPADGPRVVVRHRRAMRHLLFSPDELGLARAFVSGDLDVEGDLVEALRRCWAAHRDGDLRRLRFGPRRWLDLLRGAVRLGAIGPRPAIPQSEARLPGPLHSRKRDRSAIAHHYDLGNAFYALLLDPSMAYSCGYFGPDEQDLHAAQETKLDVICRKLDLRAGTRMLDVGCGWGSLVLYAAQHYQVHATGVTLSRQQYDHVQRRVHQLGLHDRVRIRLQDYRELTDEPYDAVASVEMGEHVGETNYPGYAATLFRVLKPRGRLLLQQMSRGTTAPGGGPFIESYIAPDMSMVPLGRTVERLEIAGFEVRDVEAMREHYARTVSAWAQTLEERREEAIHLLGQERHCVWRLYLAGGLLAFEENRMGVHQILAARPDVAGGSGMPAVVREGAA